MSEEGITMHIYLAKTDPEIAACYPVMHELRPHISQKSFVKHIREQQSQGYELACLAVDDHPVAVAGFRIGQKAEKSRSATNIRIRVQQRLYKYTDTE